MATHHMMRCIRLLCAEHEGENEHSSLLKVKVTLEFLPESWGRSNAPVPSTCCAQRKGAGARGGMKLQNQVRYNCIDEPEILPSPVWQQNFPESLLLVFPSVYF